MGAGPKFRHQIYQALTRIALRQSDVRLAQTELSRSAKVGQDDTSPFNYRLDAAKELLERGYARDVLNYANAALVASPGDGEALALRNKAITLLPPR